MTEHESKPLFYNYIIVDPRKPVRFSCEHLNMSLLYEPIYVGKGLKRGNYDRKNHHVRPSCWYDNLLYRKVRKILKDYNKQEFLSYVIQINEHEHEEPVFDIETMLIKDVGRIDKGTGTLCNLNDGGKGGWSGHSPKTKGKTFEEVYGEDRAREMREKMSKATSGQLNGASSTNMPEHLRKDKGRRSYQTRKKNGQVRTGKQHNFSRNVLGEEGMKQKTDKMMETRRSSGQLEQSVNNMQEAKKLQSEKYILVSPAGTKYVIHFNLSPFCKEHGLSYDAIYSRMKKGQSGIISINKAGLSTKMLNTIGWELSF